LMTIEIMLVAICFAAVVGIFVLVAFNMGVEIGRDSIVLEEVVEDEGIKPGKVYHIATDDIEDEEDDVDDVGEESDDEATAVERMRQKIEDSKVNRFFD
jgi:hypothetical protein